MEKARFIKAAISAVALLLVLGLGVFGISKLANNKKTPRIIASNFIGYDLARATMGDEAAVVMLMKPGSEAHDFEPTPEDIIRIKNADLLIYVGGESDEWIEGLLHDNEISEEKTLRLMDYVEAKEEELADGMEEEVEYDEHIWTSPINTIKLLDGVRDKISSIYPERGASFSDNANLYRERFLAIDESIRNVVANSSKKELIFGDRFPFRYLVDEYGLDYYAAFPGCSEQTEASSQTIAFLINKAKASDAKVILKIELTSDKLAQAIADEVGARVMTLNAAHNISQKDFDKGLTYADIMEENIDVLREALR